MTMPWHCQLACSLARWRRRGRRRRRRQCLGIASLLACSLACLLTQRRQRWRRRQCLGIASSLARSHDGGGGSGADDDGLASRASSLACSLACSRGGGGDDVDDNASALPACVLACARAAAVAAWMMMPLHRLPFTTCLLAQQQQWQHWHRRCLGIAGSCVTRSLAVLLSPPPPVCTTRVVGSDGSRAPFGQ